MIPIVGGNADELEMGEIDLTLGPARYLVPGHSSERLYEDEFVCLDWSGNRQLDRDLSLDTYLRLGHVAVRFGKHRELPTFDEWFTQHLTHDRRIEVVTTAFNLVPQLLIGTSRIATVHRASRDVLSAIFAVAHCRAAPEDSEIRAVHAVAQIARPRSWVHLAAFRTKERNCGEYPE